jgi:hypothetical protein
MVIDSGPQLTTSFHRLLLLASFATIVAAAAILGRRYRGIDELNNVRNLVRASYLLGLSTFSLLHRPSCCRLPTLPHIGARPRLGK